ncbi:NADPH-dependent FMN reductase [Streptomyces alkaliphilus]|uniref:NADPH-dependent FMN reductase n=1 Tax=Streptomyces alkaliphilus TaxID=1472722 RepID=A0A7W3Y0R8_9ACTN|nr:NADPH-dependent FMN reductase [Streptomyces alkaliphilus]MBB0243939.1 NADPH-dependent FMN reductase [Streptomyces alkaliphilus]
MSAVFAVSGSPSERSRTSLLVHHVIERLSLTGFDAAHLAVRDLPAEDLLHGRADAPAVRAAVDAVALADGLIVATPLYKASYSGLLKTFLDLLPQSTLTGKTVLPLVTGGTRSHLLAIDYALRPVLVALGARHVVGGCFVLDRDIEPGAAGGVTLAAEAELRLFDVLDHFIEALPAAGASLAPSLP